MAKPAAAPDEERIRVLIADDHELFRGGLRHMLEEQGFDVVAEVADGSQAVEQVADLLPDVVLMDINMPVLTGVEATRGISEVAPLVRVLVLTISAEETDVLDAIVAGASGYLLKNASLDDLAAGIRAAAAGESLISPTIASKLLDNLRAGAASARSDAERNLSERELEVLRLLATGMDNAEIARELFLSPKTVKNHISSILRKLQMESRIEAALYAVKSGLV